MLLDPVQPRFRYFLAVIAGFHNELPNSLVYTYGIHTAANRGESYCWDFLQRQKYVHSNSQDVVNLLFLVAVNRITGSDRKTGRKRFLDPLSILKDTSFSLSIVHVNRNPAQTLEFIDLRIERLSAALS